MARERERYFGISVKDFEMRTNRWNKIETEEPQLLLREIAVGRPFPVEALGPMENIVRAIQGKTLAPMAISATSSLCIAALAVQAFHDVETLNGSCPLSLYGLTIARSGERKSSCDAPLMAEIRKFEQEQAAEYREALAKHENDYAIWKATKDRIISDAKSSNEAKQASAADALEALGKAPTPPPSIDRTVTEPTFEGLTRKLTEGIPTIGIFSDEAGQFLGGPAMSTGNRQKTMAALNDLWHGNPIRRTRRGDGSVTLCGKRLAVHLMVQPGVARAFMADPMAADTGFLPRFLICEPPSTIGTRLQSDVRDDPVTLSQYNERLRAILETALPMDAETRELRPKRLELSAGARERLCDFADAIEQEQLPEGAYYNITGFASKTVEQAARIAGVLTTWEDLGAYEVSEVTMSNAIKLADFYLSEAKRLSDAAVFSARMERADQLRVWLLERWTEPNVLPSDIIQRAPVRALRESPTAKEAISILETHGWLLRLPKGVVIRGKARKEAYRIVRP